MAQFVVKGPFAVPLRKGLSGGRLVHKEMLQEISSQSEDLTKPGCYVFACASGRGSLPVYVGQASKNIFREAFNDRNINNLNEYLSYRKKARIELYIIHQNNVKGGSGNQDCIDDIEDWLIGFASRRTTKLLNIHGARPTPWSIAGVANHAKGGHPGSSVLGFKAMMGMTIKRPKGIGKPLINEDAEIEPQCVESVRPDTEEAAQIEEAISEAESGASSDSPNAVGVGPSVETEAGSSA
jgi:hypothetical protein